jgi:hypothetical protein
MALPTVGCTISRTRPIRTLNMYIIHVCKSIKKVQCCLRKDKDTAHEIKRLYSRYAQVCVQPPTILPLCLLVSLGMDTQFAPLAIEMLDTDLQ